jgi:hypothetical protein
MPATWTERTRSSLKVPSARSSVAHYMVKGWRGASSLGCLALTSCNRMVLLSPTTTGEFKAGSVRMPFLGERRPLYGRVTQHTGAWLSLAIIFLPQSANETTSGSEILNGAPSRVIT